jgi:hypothetical protein
MFTGPSCGLCKGTHWRLEKRKFHSAMRSSGC